MKFKIAGIGELLWDIFPNGKRLGGAPANFSYHIQALGAEAFVVSCVGNDAPGDGLRLKLKMAGLTDEYVVSDMIHPTGSVVVSIDRSGQPQYIIMENVAYDFIAILQRHIELAGCLDAVCFGTLAQRSEVSSVAIRHFLSILSKSILKVLDINLRQSYYSRSVIEQSLSLCSVLKLNEQELYVLSDIMSIRGSSSVIASKLITMFKLDLVAITKGEHGSIIYTGDREYIHPGIPAKICNTVGAGDAFTAALVMGMLRGDSVQKISEDANKLASQVCQMQGATTA